MEEWTELEELKILLGIELENLEKDKILNFILGKTKEMVKNYCAIEEIPKELKHTIFSIAVELYRENEYGSEELLGKVSSISEGDMAIHFDGTKSGYYPSATLLEGFGGLTFLKNYTMQLDQFRKMRW